MAIENARLLARVQELALVEDRERIARDLHDRVIQRLFANGLALQATLRLIRTKPQAAEERIEAAIDDLGTRTRLRRSSCGRRDDDSRAKIAARMCLTREAAGVLGFEPRVLFDGPVDTLVPADVGTELLATLREALSNVARHAHARRVDVEVLAVDGVRLRVIDDGVGPDPSSRGTGHGMANMRARAERVGGMFELGAGPSGGTVLEWRVPRADPPPP